MHPCRLCQLSAMCSHYFSGAINQTNVSVKPRLDVNKSRLATCSKNCFPHSSGTDGRSTTYLQRKLPVCVQWSVPQGNAEVSSIPECGWAVIGAYRLTLGIYMGKNFQGWRNRGIRDNDRTPPFSRCSLVQMSPMSMFSSTRGVCTHSVVAPVYVPTLVSQRSNSQI